MCGGEYYDSHKVPKKNLGRVEHMTMRVQNHAQATYAATQQTLAPLTGKNAEAVKTSDEPQKAAGSLNAPAYTVETSDAAREKYAAGERGTATEDQQGGSTTAKSPLTAPDGANTVEAVSAAADNANAVQSQENPADEEEQPASAGDDAAEEVGAPNEERGDKPNSPLDARLRKLRQKLADAKRAAVPNDEKKTRVAEIKRQIQTLEGQIAAQQSCSV